MRLVSTRTPGLRASFTEAVVLNTPGDGGLFMPEDWAPIPALEDLLALPWRERNVEVLTHLLGSEFSREDLASMAGEAFDFPAPLAPLDGDTFALELFHGPTLAFKDFGARFLAAVLGRIGGGPRTILTATSGDTGAAVASAFWRRPGFRAVVLYPEGRISPMQERQIACLGENVEALAVAGSFDDCQRLAKACFQDRGLVAETGLTSANSINIGRLLAQVLYYLESAARLRALGIDAPPLISVPSGNFGNLCAGLLAKGLGMRASFVAATNANRTVPDYLDTGAYAPRPSVRTLSSAMDVGEPSNWERIAWLFRGDWREMRGELRWGSVDEAATLSALRTLRVRGYQADPHGAVAYEGLRRARVPGRPGIFLVTAHPGKFREELEASLGGPVPEPTSLASLNRLPLLNERMPADLAVLEGRLRAGMARH
jgi:threonine synthase